jgi:hypothetical protein
MGNTCIFYTYFVRKTRILPCQGQNDPCIATRDRNCFNQSANDLKKMNIKNFHIVAANILQTSHNSIRQSVIFQCEFMKFVSDYYFYEFYSPQPCVLWLIIIVVISIALLYSMCTRIKNKFFFFCKNTCNMPQ